MGQNCCAVPQRAGGNVMILACSGGSNVGQLSNQVAVELTREGFGGIQKNKNFDLDREIIDRVKGAVKEACRVLAAEAMAAEGIGSCCG